MSYDPLEPNVRDRIRRLVRDHSGDPEEEIFPDETYDRVIGQHDNWKRACAEMALSVAGALEDEPDRVKDYAWSQRTKSLYALASQMIAEADEEDAEGDEGGDVPIISMWSVVVPGPTW